MDEDHRSQIHRFTDSQIERSASNNIHLAPMYKYLVKVEDSRPASGETPSASPVYRNISSKDGFPDQMEVMEQIGQCGEASDIDGGRDNGRGRGGS